MTIPQDNKAQEPLAQEKIDTTLTQTQSDASSSQPVPEQTKSTQEEKEDPNWRAFREARKKDRAEREAAEKRAAEKEAEAAALKAAMEAAFARDQSNNRQMNNSYPEHIEEGEDERIERKVQEAIKQRENQFRKETEERERALYPQRLQQTYADFSSMVSQENLDYLDFHYPEVSRPLQRLQDGYDKWSDIYLAVKKFVPNQAHVKKDSMRAEQNQMKPRSISSDNVIQPHEQKGAVFLSEDRKAANWQRMQKTMNQMS